MTSQIDIQFVESLQKEVIQLLKKLIATPSFSKEEANTASFIDTFLQEHAVKTNRVQNNIWATNLYFDSTKPTILLNSHHDTVKPNKGYTLDPFNPIEQDGKLFGLGSNDAGGCLVSLIACFLYYYNSVNLPYNILLIASAEEEISGLNGIELILKEGYTNNDIQNMVKENIGTSEDKTRFFPFVFVLFIFLALMNMFGLVPYTFTPTSHIAVTFGLSLSIFLGCTIIGFQTYKLDFFAMFMPAGAPL
jgi:metal-dependent amidase/aminoacylase/carboxypeptidase family protein